MPPIRLISSGGDTDVVQFLKSYRRVPADKACSTRVEANQVTLWVFVRGRWVRREVEEQPKNSRSWCQNYLASVVSPADYERVKKELFAGRGINGVYKHQSEPLYAVVYRPSGFNKRALAALAGGVALAGGLGVAYNRYGTPKIPTNSTASYKVPSINTGGNRDVNDMKTELQTRTRDIRTLLDCKKDAIIKLEGDFKSYVDLFHAYNNECLRLICLSVHFTSDDDQPGSTLNMDRMRTDIKQHEQDVKEYSDLVEEVEILNRLQKSPNELESILKLPTYAEIIDTSLWKTHSNDLCTYFKLQSDDGDSKKCQSIYWFASSLRAMTSCDYRGFNYSVLTLKDYLTDEEYEKVLFELVSIAEQHNASSQILIYLYEGLHKVRTTNDISNKLIQLYAQFITDFKHGKPDPTGLMVTSRPRIQDLIQEDVKKRIAEIRTSEDKVKLVKINELLANANRYGKSIGDDQYYYAFNTLTNSDPQETIPILRHLYETKLRSNQLIEGEKKYLEMALSRLPAL
jgi:hypothetical protein